MATTPTDDLRSRLADALRAHRPNRLDTTIDQWECMSGCNYPMGAGKWYDHLADVLLSLPGIAIVEWDELARLREENVRLRIQSGIV